MLISNSLAPTGLWKCSIFRKCTTHLLSTKQKPPTPSPPSSHLLPPPFIQFGPLFQRKPLKSLLLSCDPPQATGPAHRLRVPSSTRCSSGPQSGRRSPEVRASGSRSRPEQKGKRRSKEQQESSSEPECQRWDKIHWTGNIAHTNTRMHTRYTCFVYYMMGLVFILACNHPNLLRTFCSHINPPLNLPTHLKSIIITWIADDPYKSVTSVTIISWTIY